MRGGEIRKGRGHTPFVSRSAAEIDFERALGESVKRVGIVVVQAIDNWPN